MWQYLNGKKGSHAPPETRVVNQMSSLVRYGPSLVKYGSSLVKYGPSLVKYGTRVHFKHTLATEILKNKPDRQQPKTTVQMLYAPNKHTNNIGNMSFLYTR